MARRSCESDLMLNLAAALKYGCEERYMDTRSKGAILGVIGGFLWVEFIQLIAPSAILSAKGSLAVFLGLFAVVCVSYGVHLAGSASQGKHRDGGSS